MTPLHWAAFNGKPYYRLHTNSEIEKHVIKIHILSGHKHIAELLIKNGANVNSQAIIDGNTPLLKAAENGSDKTSPINLIKCCENWN